MTRTLSFACLVGGALLALASGAQASELGNAARSGDRDAVRSLLATAGARVDETGRDGMTPLLWAVQNNDVEIARLLLGAGADANAGNRYGITPLWVAATNRNAALVRLLLDSGATASAALPHGETPLMAAARAGDAESVRLLAAAGADPNAREASLGETALMWAAAENHADAVRALVAAGADPDLPSMALDLAPMNWLQIGMVSTVLPVGGWPPLLFAARQNAPQAALALLEVGADPNVRDPDGLTALNIAVMNEHYDFAAALLEAGADPEAADRTGMTPLYGAVEMASLGPVIGRPAIPRASDMDARSFMRLAIAKGADPDVRLKAPILAQHHGFPDRSLGAGATPLMRAAKGHDLETIELLLGAGATATARQDDGSGVLHAMATARARRSDLELAVARDVVATLLESGVDLEATAADGQTAMHRAARAGNTSLVTLLVELGARLDHKDNEGRTPYDIVTAPGRTNNPEMAALLKRLAGG